jgi:hypothetical protein
MPFLAYLLFAAITAGAEPAPLPDPVAVEAFSEPIGALTEPEALTGEVGAMAEGQLDLAELATLRGGDGFTAVISDQTLTAINSGNTLTASTIGSGDINLGQGAFSGFAGLGNFAINTGHNNNLQSSVSISINITAPVGP